MGRTHGIQLETRIWWRRFQETDQEANRRSRQGIAGTPDPAQLEISLYVS